MESVQEKFLDKNSRVLRVGKYGTKKIEVLKLPKSFKNLSTSICEHGFQTTAPKKYGIIFSNTEYPYFIYLFRSRFCLTPKEYVDHTKGNRLPPLRTSTDKRNLSVAHCA
jgi:hypothetical protein